MPLDPDTYTDILERVARGELITDVCRDYGIPRNKLWRYAEENGEEARNAYTRARTLQAHSLAEDTVIVSRSARGLDSDGVAAVRLEVDTLKWLTTKIAPRLYGDKLQVDATVDVNAMSREQQIARLAALLAHARLGSTSRDASDDIAQHVTVHALTDGSSRDTGGGSDTETVAGGAD